MPTEKQLDITLESELEFKPDHIHSTLPNMEQKSTTLPEDLRNEIDKNAKAYARSHGRKAIGYYALNYEAGATAYAPWKVKHDLLLLENDRLRKALEAIREGHVNPSYIANKALEGKGGGNG